MSRNEDASATRECSQGGLALRLCVLLASSYPCKSVVPAKRSWHGLGKSQKRVIAWRTCNRKIQGGGFGKGEVGAECNRVGMCVGSVTGQEDKGAWMIGLPAASDRWDGPDACEGWEPTRQAARNQTCERSVLSVCSITRSINHLRSPQAYTLPVFRSPSSNPRQAWEQAQKQTW